MLGIIFIENVYRCLEDINVEGNKIIALLFRKFNIFSSFLFAKALDCAHIIFCKFIRQKLMHSVTFLQSKIDRSMLLQCGKRERGKIINFQTFGSCPMRAISSILEEAQQLLWFFIQFFTIWLHLENAPLPNLLLSLQKRRPTENRSQSCSRVHNWRRMSPPQPYPGPGQLPTYHYQISILPTVIWFCSLPLTLKSINHRTSLTYRYH